MSKVSFLAVAICLLTFPPKGVRASMPQYSHVVLVLEENHSYEQVIGNLSAPFINGTLVPHSAVAANYHAITHASLPNYLGLIDGNDYHGSYNVTHDCSPSTTCAATGPTIVDALGQAGKSWKLYAESMPSNCAKSGGDPYAVRHNPFAYYPAGTQTDSQCSSRDVPFSQFTPDLNRYGLPSLSVVVPNLCHDMHDTCSVQNTVTAGDSWLQNNVYTPLVQSATWTRWSHMLFIVIWDEGSRGVPGEACLSSTDTSCHVAAVFRSNDGTVRAGTKIGTWGDTNGAYSHLSLLATIEDVLGLARTPSVSSIPAMTDVF